MNWYENCETWSALRGREPMTWGSTCPICGSEDCNWSFGGYCEGRVKSQATRIEALEARAEAAEARVARLEGVAHWYDSMMEKHVTPTGKPARISDEQGVWHDGPAADMAQKILRGLQNVFRAALAEQDKN